MTIRVLVVDDDALIRLGIVMLLERLPDIEVVGEAGDGEGALAQAAALCPDVVLTDLRMPGLSGIDVAGQLCSGQRPTTVLLLTTFDEDPDVRAALLAGASGYVLKQTAPRDLAEALRRVAAGDTWLDPGIAGHVVAALRRAPLVASTPPKALVRLTAREREVLSLMAQGMTNAEIAAQLWVGAGTVKTHVSRILHKTASRDRAQAVALAYGCGLVSCTAPE